MPNYEIIEINDSNISALQQIADEATSQGYEFVQRTIDEWKSGVNTFSKPSEKLWGMIVDGEIIGLGGLNQDPFTDDPTLGRARHVYVAEKYRGHGLSKVILNLIITRAKEYFKSLRLATTNPIAVSLYESLGFVNDDSKTPADIRAQYPDRRTYYLYW